MLLIKLHTSINIKNIWRRCVVKPNDTFTRDNNTKKSLFLYFKVCFHDFVSLTSDFSSYDCQIDIFLFCESNINCLIVFFIFGHCVVSLFFDLLILISLWYPLPLSWRLTIHYVEEQYWEKYLLRNIRIFFSSQTRNVQYVEARYSNIPCSILRNYITKTSYNCFYHYRLSCISCRISLNIVFVLCFLRILKGLKEQLQLRSKIMNPFVISMLRFVTLL